MGRPGRRFGHGDAIRGRPAGGRLGTIPAVHNTPAGIQVSRQDEAGRLA